MRLTTRSRFALTAMTDVAVRGVHGPVTLASVHERHGISLSYLEIIFSALRRARLVMSTRGPGGGYSLARSPRDITVADIAMASEQWAAGPASQDSDSMSADQGAMTHALWLTGAASIHFGSYCPSFTRAPLFHVEVTRAMVDLDAYDTLLRTFLDEVETLVDRLDRQFPVKDVTRGV